MKQVSSFTIEDNLGLYQVKSPRFERSDKDGWGSERAFVLTGNLSVFF